MTQTLAPATRILVNTAALIIIIAGLRQSAPLIVPFLLSVFIAVICFPLMCRLQHEVGLPRWLALTVVMVLVVVIAVALTLLIGTSVNDFSQSLPEYQQKISDQWSYILVWLDQHGISITQTLQDVVDPAAAVSLVSSILKGFGKVMANSFLIVLTVIFILMEAAGITQKILDLREARGSKTSAEVENFSEVFVDKLRNYMSIKTIISMITGLVIGISLWLVGVDYPVLWAVLAFMLNYVPNIGSLIAAVPAVMLTLVQLGTGSAVLVALVYTVVNVIIGSVLEPRFMGKGLGLSTLVVFISLVFWGWVLGPVGMLLSVPLTITVKLALDSNPETEWLGHLLGPVDE